MSRSHPVARRPWLEGVRRLLTRAGTDRLSVVVSCAVADVGLLDRVLADLAAQRLGPDLATLEVILAPWGPGDPGGILAIAAASRVDCRVGRHATTGNAARNAGAALASGAHLVFLDPLTRLRPGALETLLGSAATARGSQGYRVVRAVGDRAPFHPASYLFSAVHWQESGMRFEEDHGDFPEATCARALVSRPLRIQGQLWDREPAPDRAAGAMPRWADRLEPWLRMVPVVRQLVTGPEKGQWIRDLVVSDLADLLGDAEHLPYARLPELADTVGAVLAALPPNDLSRIPVEARVAAWLGGQAHWGDLATVLDERVRHEGQFPTRTEGTRIFAELPGLDTTELHVPPAMLEVGLDQSRLGASVRRVRWLTDGVGSHDLAVDVVVFVAHLELTEPVVQARWVSGQRSVPAVVRPRPDAYADLVAGQRHQSAQAGSVTALTHLADLPPGDWHLELALSQGAVVRTGNAAHRDLGGSAGKLRPSPDGSAQPLWDARGLRLLVAGERSFKVGRQTGLRVVHVRREDDWLALDTVGPVDGVPLLQTEGETIAGHADGEVLRFRLRTDRFGEGPLPAPCGSYRLVVGARPVVWDEAASDDLAHDIMMSAHRVGVRRTPRSGVLLVLRPPLRDDELGGFAQQRLLASYDVEQPLADQVLLESASGRACAGSPLAIDRELARVAPGVERLWSVEDHSFAVPDGARAVLRHSREWYDAAATARWLVLDGDLPDFFERRAGQHVLATLGGHPSRAVGVPAWEELNYPPRRVDQLLARSAGQWSALLAANGEQERVLTEAFRYAGTVLPVGLPRTDLLLGPGAAERRLRTRQRLGMADTQTVVLHAPEPGPRPRRSTRMRELVEVTELCEGLGEDWTVLHLGAAPLRRAEVEGARLVDVSGHPSVAELMLASDAAVFDYSPLRFDYAVTGRPMVFAVPDDAVRRGDARGFLVPYLETVPGPVVSDVAGVVDRLRDLDTLEAEHGPALAEFNARFNDHADGSAAARVVAEMLGPRFRQSRLSLASRPPDDPTERRFRVVR